jgi:hypothetical protein
MNIKNVILALILTLFAGCASIKMVDIDQYQKIVTADGKSKDDLYFLANRWFAETFRSAEDVIQYHNKDYGNITGKGILTYSVAPTPLQYKHEFRDVRVIVVVDCKDNAAKITIKPLSTREIDRFAKGIKEQLELLADDFDLFLQQKIEW